MITFLPRNPNAEKSDNSKNEENASKLRLALFLTPSSKKVDQLSNEAANYRLIVLVLDRYSEYVRITTSQDYCYDAEYVKKLKALFESGKGIKAKEFLENNYNKSYSNFSDADYAFFLKNDSLQAIMNNPVATELSKWDHGFDQQAAA
jgi:hypothetical protein